MCGSPQYVAPEIYQHYHGYDERCDLWSAGVVLFVILGGYAPFEGSPVDLPGIICEGRFQFDYPEWSHISDTPKQLIKRLLVVDPDERATTEEALDGEWLKRRDKESLHRHSNGSSKSFDAWLKLQHESNASICKYATDVLRLEEDENIEEFAGDDPLSINELTEKSD